MPLFFYFLAFNLATANENREKINLLTEVDFDFTLSFEFPFFSLLSFLMPRTLWVEQFSRLATYAIIDDAWYKYYDFFNPVGLVQYLKNI